ncbi:hypothetical protein DWX71_10605 [Ruminococcus bromii]|nr:hypothetical protein DWX71_10605 [Ruminococcus bromii]
MIKEFYIMQQFSKKSFKEFLYDRRGDIASTVQNFIENVVVSIINNYTKKYGIKNICLAGGLFLNCLTNHKILEKCDIDNVFILPSPVMMDKPLAAHTTHILKNSVIKNHLK